MNKTDVPNEAHTVIERARIKHAVKEETIKIDQALESRYSNRELKNDFQE